MKTSSPPSKPRCHACHKKLSKQCLRCPTCDTFCHDSRKCSGVAQSLRRHPDFQWHCSAVCIDEGTKMLPFYLSPQKQASHIGQLHMALVEIGGLARHKHAVWKSLAVEQYDVLLLLDTRVAEEASTLRFPSYILLQNKARTLAIYAQKALLPVHLDYSSADNRSFELLVVGLGGRGGVTLALCHRPSHLRDHRLFADALTDFLMRVLWATNTLTRRGDINDRVSAQRFLLAGHMNIQPFEHTQMMTKSSCESLSSSVSGRRSMQGKKYGEYLEKVAQRFHLRQVLPRARLHNFTPGTLLFLGHQVCVDRHGYGRISPNDRRSPPLLWLFATMRERATTGVGFSLQSLLAHSRLSLQPVSRSACSTLKSNRSVTPTLRPSSSALRRCLTDTPTLGDRPRAHFVDEVEGERLSYDHVLNVDMPLCPFVAPPLPQHMQRDMMTRHSLLTTFKGDDNHDASSQTTISVDMGRESIASSVATPRPFTTANIMINNDMYGGGH